MSSPYDLRASRLREGMGDKAVGAVVALVLEALLLLLLLSLGAMQQHREAPVAVVAFDAHDYTETKQPPAPKPEKDHAAAAPRLTQPQPVTPSPPVAQPAPPMPPAVILPVSPQQVQTFDLANVAKPPKAPAGPAYGPAYTPAFGDSKRVGTAPNGQPMYAAAWYPHEPTHEQMAGYLSTAEPGWALITCKTVPDYRVEDCVGLDEYPENSHLIRAVLAAAWQFRIRPPRVNGVLQVGDWVRVRVTYEEKAAPAYGDPPRP